MFQELFEKIEKETDVIDWKVDGIYIWRYERFTIHRYFTEKEYQQGARVQIARDTNGKRLLDFIKLYLRHPEKPQGKKDILIFNHSRRVWDGDVFVCKYTEEISRHYDNSVTYETVFNDKHLEPTDTHDLRYLDRIILESYLYELLNKKFVRIKYKKTFEVIKKRLEDLLGDYAQEDDIKYVAKSMTKNLYLIKYRMGRMERMISAINPKIIIEVVGYSRNNMIVNEIAKRKKIPTIELQHSQINEQLVQYMWPTHRKMIEQFPEYLFTFGEFWSYGLELPIDEKHVVPVGFAYFEDQIEKTKKKKICENLESDVVFISQYMAGKTVYELAMECCKLNDDLRILYKLHPEEYDIWEQRYPELKEYPNIHVITDVSVSLYDCFAATHAVVGVFSGALYEAVAFDLPIYLYQDGQYIKNMEKLIDINGAKVINSAKELLNDLEQTGAKKTVAPEQEIWKKNAETNLFREIDRIINDNEREK